MFGKLVIATIAPLGTALLLAVAGLALATRGRGAWRRRGLLAIAGGLGWLWFWSMPLASDAVRGWLEAQAGPAAVGALPRADAIVVLGGALRGARPPQRPHPDLRPAADRLWHAARLYRAGKAPWLLLSGGSVHGDEAPEADAMRQLLVELGVPPGAMLLERESLTTAQNAAFSARVLRARGLRRVLLVTSALHMGRARALFEREGLQVVAAPTDQEVVPRPLAWLDLVPDAQALEGSGRAFKEIVGRWAGR